VAAARLRLASWLLLVVLASGACRPGSNAQPGSSPDPGGPVTDAAAARADVRPSVNPVPLDAALSPPDLGPGDATPAVDGAAGPPEPASLGGVWSGALAKLPFSFVVNEDGVVTDLSIRLHLQYDGDGCYITFTARTQPTIAGGRARVEVGNATASFPVNVNLTFTSETEVTVANEAYQGSYQIRCVGPMEKTGNTTVLAAGTARGARARRLSNPAPGAVKIAGPAGNPMVIGSFAGSCTNQPGSTADRWCGFARTGPAGDNELWVFNISRVLAGEKVSCEPGANDPRCVRLSTTLWTEMQPASGDRHPAAHRFIGDTLVFLAHPASGPNEAFDGDVMAWRPGWAAPHWIATGSAGVCSFDEASDAALCFENYRNTDAMGLAVDLSAGRLGDGTADLPFIDSLLLLTSEDRMLKRSGRYQAALSPGGEYVLWSARPDETAAAKEILYLLKLGTPPAGKKVLGTDVSRWRVSADGRKLFWLKAPGFTSPTMILGGLEAVDFPSGLNLKGFEAAVRSYFEVPRPVPMVPGLVVLSGYTQLRYFPSRDVGFGSGVTLDTNTTATRRFDTGGSFLTFSHTINPDDSSLSDLQVIPLDPPRTPCAAVTTTTAYSQPVFSSSGRYLLADTEPPEQDRTGELLRIESRGCVQTKVADRTYQFTRVPGDRFLVTAENLPLRRLGMASLFVLHPPGEAGGAAERVQENLAGTFGLLQRSDQSNDYVHVVFTLSAGWKSDGVYVQTQAFAR
jgi:hypothetical protein